MKTTILMLLFSAASWAQSLFLVPTVTTAEPGSTKALLVGYLPTFEPSGEVQPIVAISFKINIFPGGSAGLSFVSGSGIQGKTITCSPTTRGLSCIVRGPNNDPLGVGIIGAPYVKFDTNTIGMVTFTIDEIVAERLPEDAAGGHLGVPMTAAAPAYIEVR